MRVHFLFLLRVINDIKEHVLRTRTWTRASVTRTRACGTRTREYLSAVCCVSSNFPKPIEATQIFALFNIDKSLSRNCQSYLNNYLALVRS